MIIRWYKFKCDECFFSESFLAPNEKDVISQARDEGWIIKWWDRKQFRNNQYCNKTCVEKALLQKNIGKREFLAESRLD